MACNVSAILDVVPCGPDDRTVAFLPWAHVFGGNIEINSVFALGASTAICSAPEKLIEDLPVVKPTILFAVPTIWNRIYAGVQKNVAAQPKILQKLFHAGMSAATRQARGEHISLVDKAVLAAARSLIFGKVVARFGGRLKWAVSGAAALSRDVGEFIDNLGITVYEGYGMTETSGVATSNTPEARRMGSVGKPLPGITIKLDKEFASGDPEVGEILVYGHGVMNGYHNQPEDTAKVMTADGGLRTGDLGKLDKDGFLFITGRVKELYKLENGKYVAPAPMEEQITLSRYIAQAMIFGSDKPYNVALIVPDMTALDEWAKENGLTGTNGTLLEDAKVKKLYATELERLSSEFKGYERVKSFKLIAQPFTTADDLLTPTLKLKRRNVIKKYQPQLDALYKA